MVITKKYFLLISSFLIFSVQAHAGLIYTAADLKIGLGTNASSDGSTIKSRSLINYSVEGSLGLTYSSFIFGVIGE
ncbi:MAG: hypothetical protein Q7U04_17870, partial [Bacteriovorax sp.]|nr:hypothetical protein [Bacteriovorax sp.]